MSTSHFGSKYWLDDYFGPYFQPEGEGGVIVGALAGSAAGVATCSATLTSATQTQSGTRRLAASVSASWNVDRISAMLGSVRQLLGRVEKEVEKPKAEQEKIEVPKELIEVAAIVAPKKPKTPAIDFIPVRVSLADLDATRLLAELRAMEARLEKLDRRLSDPKPKPVRINIVKATDDDDDAALILLGMPVPKQPRKGIAIDDDDLAALLLAA